MEKSFEEFMEKMEKEVEVKINKSTQSIEKNEEIEIEEF